MCASECKRSIPPGIIYVKAYLKKMLKLARHGKTGGKYEMGLFFRALADGPRLRLLNLMGSDEVCVCYFVEVFGTNQPKVPRHLAYLRRAAVVKTRRDWKWFSTAWPSPRTLTPRGCMARCARGWRKTARCGVTASASRGRAARRSSPSASRARREKESGFLHTG